MKLTYKAKDVRGVLTPLAPFASKVAVGLSRFPKNAVLDVTVENEKRIRTLDQNARYWALIVPAFAEYCGYEAYPELVEKQDLKALKNSAHRTLKAMFIGPRRVERTLPDGRVIEEIHEPSTTELTTVEMAHLQDQAERLLNENGIYLPAEQT